MFPFLADSKVCADQGFRAKSMHSYRNAADKLRITIDAKVGSGCVTDVKFIECSGSACADVESIGACRTSNDLKETLFNVRDFVCGRMNECHNYRIVSHGGTVASRIRSL